MKIESLIRRIGGTRVKLDNIEYHFIADSTGRQIAEVTKQDHIDTLLAIDYAYKEPEKLPEGAAVATGETVVVPPATPEQLAEGAERARLEAEYEKKFMKLASPNFTTAQLREQIENGIPMEAPKNSPQTQAEIDAQKAKDDAVKLKESKKTQTAAAARASQG